MLRSDKQFVRRRAVRRRDEPGVRLSESSGRPTGQFERMDDPGLALSIPNAAGIRCVQRDRGGSVERPAEFDGDAGSAQRLDLFQSPVDGRKGSGLAASVGGVRSLLRDVQNHRSKRPENQRSKHGLSIFAAVLGPDEDCRDLSFARNNPERIVMFQIERHVEDRSARP